MSLPTHLLVVDVSIDPDVEEAWNTWYNGTHLPEITACPGFHRSARYVVEEDGKRRYLTVYEVDGPHVIASPQFSQRRGWGEFKNRVQSKMRVYKRITALEASEVTHLR